MLVALATTLPIAWRRTNPVAATMASSLAWLIPTDGYLFVGYVVAFLPTTRSPPTSARRARCSPSRRCGPSTPLRTIRGSGKEALEEMRRLLDVLRERRSPPSS